MRWIALLLLTGVLLTAACGDDETATDQDSTPTHAVEATDTQPPPPTATSSVTTTVIAPAAQIDTSGWKTYRDEEHGFELSYPPDARVSERSDFVVPFASADDVGTQINLPIAPDTNLYDKFVFVMVTDAVPDGCPPAETQRAGVWVRVNGVTFWKEDVIAGASGNRWDGAAYWAASGSRCAVLYTLLIYADLSFFADPPAAFDREEELRPFDAVVSTFRWLEE